MRSEQRRRLGADQERLLLTLLCGRPAPEGFDAERLRATTCQLVDKRWRRLMQARPELARSLGPPGAAMFRAYATASPRPLGDVQGDVLRFWRTLPPGAARSDEARVEHALAHARVVVHRGRAVERRLPCLIALWLPRRRRLVLVLRLPVLGSRVIGWS